MKQSIKQIDIYWNSTTNSKSNAKIEDLLKEWSSQLKFQKIHHGIHLESDALFEILPDILSKLQNAAFKIPLLEKLYKVQGMSCANCALSIEDILKDQKGVISAEVNYANSVLKLSYLENLVNSNVLEKLISDHSYHLEAIPDHPITDFDVGEERQFLQNQKHKAFWALIICVPIVWLGMMHMHWVYTPWILWLLSTPVIFWLGRDYFKRAWLLGRHGKVNMDTLVAMSSTVAYCTSVAYLFKAETEQFDLEFKPIYFESAAVVIAFLLLGKWLEEKTKAKTGIAIRKLMELHPATVLRVNTSGGFDEIKSAEANVGDLLLARPGDRIAVDGIVESGNSAVDESLMTGESMPLIKQIGNRVMGGSLNLEGSLTYRAQKVGLETQLAQMIQWVQKAQTTKAPVQKLTDQIASVFVPTVIFLALLSFVIWYFMDPVQGLQKGILALVTVLIVACPCALGLATPTAVIVGMGKAAQHGILIRDAGSLEQVKSIDTLIFDKTGTLTHGIPKLTNVRWFTDIPDHREILKSMAIRSDHPLAKAIEIPSESEMERFPDFYKNHPGLGVEAGFNNIKYFLGSHKFLKQQAQHLISGKLEMITAVVNAQESLVYFFNEENILASLTFRDEIRTGIPGMIRNLKIMNLSIWMLSGDRKSVAESIAKIAGIDRWKGEQSPADKLEFVKKLQSEKHKVAMVGDGINDSPALAQANVSIAMGLGSDIAKETSDIVIVSSEVTKLPMAIGISKATLQTIRQNLFWAFFYNIIGIPIAAGLLYPIWGIWMNPMMAGMAMAFSSVSVVLNSLRLRYKSF
ncbi:MAG: copper-translocating P-type ATPase [Saprospiraceae bacterium]|nr:copper-translocating P-type ATPase [Saprospiraceae bacterium]